MKLIAVSGMIGTGKTTLCDNIARTSGWALVRENTDRNPFLAHYYGDRNRWALASQVRFLLNKTTALQRELALSPQVVLVDRTMQEDVFVFTDTLIRTKKITGAEYELIRDLYEFLLASWPRTDYSLYLEDTVTNCFQRLRSRGQLYETNITIEDLNSLSEQYQTWKQNFLTGSHTVLNSSVIDFRDDAAVSEIIRLVEEEIRKP